jgi:LmbE family N-acetylglucosaminyl deacetylase
MKIIADTLIELDEQTVCIYSNSDAGYLKMMELLESRIRDKKKEHKIKVYKTLSHEIFLSLMKQADVMIGNSSSGIIEAPSCETPYVLVGTRQRGREKADSILEVDYKKEEILKAVKKVFTDVKFKKIVKTCEKPYDPFDDADAGKRIAKILATFKITPELFEKKIAYHRFSEKTSKLLFSRDRSDKLDGKTKVLVISPHPDDEVLGCGGTILRHRKDGDEIFLCIVTKGYAPDWSEEFLKNRPKEIERASKILGIKKTYFLNYPTVKLDTIPQKELNEAIAKIIHELEPNILYIPHKGDLNKDHRLVFEASLVATRPGSYKPEKILSYEILSETEWGQIIEPFVPNVYVDISSTFEEKIESMKAYASELRQYPHLRSLEIIEALAKKRGAEMGMRLAEAFISIREVG